MKHRGNEYFQYAFQCAFQCAFQYAFQRFTQLTQNNFFVS